MYWDGEKILDQENVGPEALKGPIPLVDASHHLGICHLMAVSKDQPLEPDGFDGTMANFNLWPSVLEDQQMIDFTSCHLPLEDYPAPTLWQYRLKLHLDL